MEEEDCDLAPSDLQHKTFVSQQMDDVVSTVQTQKKKQGEKEPLLYSLEEMRKQLLDRL